MQHNEIEREKGLNVRARERERANETKSKKKKRSLSTRIYDTFFPFFLFSFPNLYTSTKNGQDDRPTRTVENGIWKGAWHHRARKYYVG